MSGAPQAVDGELRLAPESVEAIANRTAELLRGEAEPQAPKRLISAAKVADTWGWIAPGYTRTPSSSALAGWVPASAPGCASILTRWPSA
jgi:hypothetical protein